MSVPHCSSFYERTRELLPPERTEAFLKLLPTNATMLDVGCGTGRWAASFRRDRPDLTIDVIDRDLSKALHISDDWPGQRYEASFIQFTPEKSYDGIWAFASLFFAAADALEPLFAKLAASLAPGGVVAFTMVEDSEAARQFRFTGMSRESLLALLTRLKLRPLVFEAAVKPYGDADTPILTYFVTAQRDG